MFKTQTKWKLCALFLAAPLLMPAVARADYDQNYNPDQIRGTLKDILKWRGTDGSIYLFRQNGQFEYRAGRVEDDPSLSKEFGRFIVRPAKAGDNAIGGEKVILQLNVTSSLHKPSRKGGESRVVQRVLTYLLPIKVMSKFADGSGGNDTGAGGPDIFYIVIGEDRFDDGRPG